MRASRFTAEQIIGMLNEGEAGAQIEGSDTTASVPPPTTAGAASTAAWRSMRPTGSSSSRTRTAI